MTALQFEPLSAGRIVDRAFRLYRGSFVRFVTIIALIEIPTALLQLLSQSELPWGESPWLGVTAVLVMIVLWTFGRSLGNAALTKSISESYLGNETSVKEAYGFVLPRIWTLAWASLLVGLVVMVGYILLVVPGVILQLQYAMTTQAIVIEKLKASEGMGRSRFLSKGNLGKVFVVSFLVFIISGVVIFVMSSGAGFLAGLLGVSWPARQLMVTFADVVGRVLTGPISAAAMILLYYDLRIRKEGFDLQMLAQRLGTGLPTTPGIPDEPSKV